MRTKVFMVVAWAGLLSSGCSSAPFSFSQVPVVPQYQVPKPVEQPSQTAPTAQVKETTTTTTTTSTSGSMRQDSSGNGINAGMPSSEQGIHINYPDLKLDVSGKDSLKLQAPAINLNKEPGKRLHLDIDIPKIRVEGGSGIEVDQRK